MGHLSLPSSSSSWMSEISTESSPPCYTCNGPRPRPISLENEDITTKNLKNPAQSSIQGASNTTCLGVDRENLNLVTWSANKDSSCPTTPTRNDKSENFFDAHNNGNGHPAVHTPAQINFVPKYRDHSGSADPSNIIASNALHNVNTSHKYNLTKMEDDGLWPQIESFSSSGLIASALMSTTPPLRTEINTANKPQTVSFKASRTSNFCNLCRTAYKKCKNRFRHRIIESNKCILQCSQCPRRFRHPSLLIGHKLVHKSERMVRAKSTSITSKQQTSNSTPSLSSTVKPVLMDSYDSKSGSAEPNVIKVSERSSSSSQEEIQNDKEPTANSRSRSRSMILLANKCEQNPNHDRSFMEEGTRVRIGKKHKCPNVTRNMKLEETKMLDEHMTMLNSATRDKPYVCSACGRGLQWSRNLKRHYKLIHPEIPFGPAGFFYRANMSIQTRQGQRDEDDDSDDMYSHQSVVKAPRSAVTPSIRGPRGDRHKRKPKKLPNTIQQRLNIHILEYNCLICHELFSYRVDAVNHALLH